MARLVSVALTLTSFFGIGLIWAGQEVITRLYKNDVARANCMDQLPLTASTISLGQAGKSTGHKPSECAERPLQNNWKDSALLY